MRTHVITGSSGGFGISIRNFLESNGDKVIGVDIKDAEVIADLSNEEGRQAMIDDVGKLCGGKLEGVVANAGIGSGPNTPGALISSINYFGAVATLDGLKPMLEKGDAPRAIAVSSNSLCSVPISKKLLELYAAGDEAAAGALSNELPQDADQVYGTSKFGIMQWAREKAITPDWIGKGISLNVIAPGLIKTPIRAEGAEDAILDMGDAFPIPARRVGEPEEIGALVSYLLSENAGFMVGAMITMDGGTETALRRDDYPIPLAWI